MAVFRKNEEAIGVFKVDKIDVGSKFPINFQFLENPNYVKVSVVKENGIPEEVPLGLYQVSTQLPIESHFGSLKILEDRKDLKKLLIANRGSVFPKTSLAISEKFPVFCHSPNMLERLTVYVVKDGKAQFLINNQDYTIEYEQDNTKWCCGRIKMLKPFDSIKKLAIAKLYDVIDLKKGDKFRIPFNFFSNLSLLDISAYKEDGTIVELPTSSCKIVPDKKEMGELFGQIIVHNPPDNPESFFIGYKEAAKSVKNGDEKQIPFQFFKRPDLVKIVLIKADKKPIILKLNTDYDVDSSWSKKWPFGYIKFKKDYAEISHVCMYADVLDQTSNKGVGNYYPIYSSTLNVVAYIKNNEIIELKKDKDYKVVSLKSYGHIEFSQSFSGFSEIRIERNIPPEQLSCFCDEGIVLAKAVERSCDKQTMLIQDNMFETKRSLRVPREEAASVEFLNTDMILPDREKRKSKILGFDENGKPTALEHNVLYKAGKGIGIENNFINVLHDDKTIEINSEGKLSSKPYTSGKGIGISQDNKIFVNYDNETLTFIESASVDENGKLIVNCDNKTIGVKEVDLGNNKKEKRLAGLYESGNGIDISGNKISVNYDNKTIGVKEVDLGNNKKEKRLAGLYESGTGIDISGNKISVNGWVIGFLTTANLLGAIGTGLGLFNSFGSVVNRVPAAFTGAVRGILGPIHGGVTGLRNLLPIAAGGLVVGFAAIQVVKASTSNKGVITIAGESNNLATTKAQPEIVPDALEYIDIGDNKTLLVTKGSIDDHVKIQYSFNNGDNWEYCESFEIPSDKDIGEFAVGLIDDVVCIATSTTDGKIYIAKQTNTTSLDFTLAYTSENNKAFTHSLFGGNKFFFPLSEGGFVYSSDLSGFTLIGTDKVNSVVNAIAFDEETSTYLFICEDGKVYKTQNLTEFTEKDTKLNLPLKLILKETNRYLIFVEGGGVLASSDLCETFNKQSSNLPGAPTSAVYNGQMWLCTINSELCYMTFSDEMSINVDNKTIGFNSEGALKVLSVPNPNSIDIEILPTDWESLEDNQWHVEKSISWLTKDKKVNLEQIEDDDLESGYEYGKIARIVSKNGTIDIYTYKNIDAAPEINLSFTISQL